MSRKRVVITGMGAVTPLGSSVASTWEGVIAGRSGIAPITHFDASGFPSKIAGEVKDFDFTHWIQKNPDLEKTMSNTRFALGACDEAIRDSGLDWDGLDPRAKGIYYAAGDGGAPVDTLASAFSRSFTGDDRMFDLLTYLDVRLSQTDGRAETEKQPAAALKHLLKFYGIRGPAYNCLTACAASAQAIGEAAEIIREGRARIMLSGGSHSMIHPFGVAGFCLLTALSTSNDSPATASRPFDAMRNGFVLSEGAGALVLEDYEHAVARGARIHGELAGYGVTADAYRLTDTHPQGVGAVESLRMAMKDAELAPEEVDYVNAHGTSTKVNDMVESLAIKEVFGERARQVPVSSTKSMTGHLIAAAGVVELQFCLLAMRDGVVPPTVNYQYPDPECDLDYVPNKSRRAEVKAALSNSFGFGGQNVVLAVKKL